MKKLQHALPCGRVIFYHEANIEDMSDNADLRKILLENRPELEKMVSWHVAGKNRKTWSRRTYSKFVNLLLEKLVDHLMKSDRIETEPGRYWIIGGKQSKKFVNWHTEGNSFGIRITGIPETHGIRMNRKRRNELRSRIEQGQSFHIEQY
jgi:nitrous oxidase accessory protein NosD